MKEYYRDRKWLEEKYLKEKLSCRRIGKLCGVSGKTIFLWLRRFNIHTRSLNEAMIIRKDKIRSSKNLDAQLLEILSSDIPLLDDFLDDLLENLKVTSP